MIAIEVIQPAETPGEDVANPPFFPVPSGAHVAHMTGGTWDQATRTAHDEHRDWCLIGCAWCDGHRAVFDCRYCGMEREADDAGDCVICRESLRAHHDEPGEL